jgi:hypothetical protein
MQSSADDAYFSGLCKRLHVGADPVEHFEVSLGNWRPEPAQCHENVNAWVRNRPQYRTVRGWLVSEQGPGLYWLTAHSVVCDQQGKLLDITPPIRDTARLETRFLRHLGTEEQFSALLPRNNQRILFCDSQT